MAGSYSSCGRIRVDDSTIELHHDDEMNETEQNDDDIDDDYIEDDDALNDVEINETISE